jgi:nitroimidazol reductase NimA-like FMN-containing flavoprotein (pyridoxamine 5'-phosphate oxidase superfamily)
MAPNDAEALLDRALVGRLGTVGADGAPYVVPMNFVYDAPSRTVFLHCATSGHLLDNLAAETRACFEVDEPGPIIAAGEYGCDTSQVYSSVICFGRAAVLSADPEKRSALELFVQKYVDRLAPDRKYDPEMTTYDATVAIAIQVETMTAKERKAP